MTRQPIVPTPPLLDLALDAHGGLERWAALGSVKATVSITGAIWAARGRSGVFDRVHVAANLHEQYVVLTPPAATGWFTIFDRGRLSLCDSNGVIECSEDPESLYAQREPSAPWTDLEAAYFATEALWTHLTLPFLFTYRDFVTAEVDSRYENGEIWRRLRVDFPAGVASHTRRQVTAFGPDGLIRRHEYTVDILAGATGAMYASDIRRFSGIAVPTTRRLYAYDRNRDRVDQPLLLAIDILELRFSTAPLDRYDPRSQPRS